ncbi:MAG: dimethylarginine dimethylaminohydrolase family protein [Planctomycetota bacterium]
MLISQLGDWAKRPSDYVAVPAPQSVLMGHPGHFRVEDVQNPLMADASGVAHRVDGKLAMRQWMTMRDAFEKSGLTCLVLEPEKDLPDLVFTANPSFALPTTSDRRDVWLAKMRYGSRQGEVDLHRGFFHAAGYLLHEMPEDVERFEGHGDGVWHPGRMLLHAGVGPRTSERAWEVLAEAYPEMDVLVYRLRPGNQYHLDTALAALDETTALIVESAFEPEGLELVKTAFPDAILLDEALGAGLYANAFCADMQTAFLPTGAPDLVAQLQERGFTVVELEMSEFHKAGGSIFCSKIAF